MNVKKTKKTKNDDVCHDASQSEYSGKYLSGNLKQNVQTFVSQMSSANVLSPLSQDEVESRVRDILIHWNPKQPAPQPANGIHTILTGERIKRPPNAYLIFAKQRRRELRMDGRQGTRMQEITAYMSLEWRQMTPLQKEPYFQVQKRLQEEHMEKYPGYVYTPAYLRKNNKNKQSNQVTKQSNDEDSS